MVLGDEADRMSQMRSASTGYGVAFSLGIVAGTHSEVAEEVTRVYAALDSKGIERRCSPKV